MMKYGWTVVLGGLVAGVVVAPAAIRGAFHLPAPVEVAPLRCPTQVPALQAGDEVRVLVWNIQYGAGTQHHFFYDGGRAVRVSADEVSTTLDKIVEVVEEIDPHLILWQEVDRGSARTAGIDQLPILAERIGHPCWAAATYHRSPYVPHPDHEHLGRVDMQLAVTGRVQLNRAERHQLATLDEPLWRQLFNLRRAALRVDVPVEGGPGLTLIDTHLSAFSRGDGTLPRQVRQIRDLTLDAANEGRAVLLAGDLNSLPPGDDPARLPEDDRALYGDAATPVLTLFDTLTPTVSQADLKRDPERFFTYVPFGGAPDRTIDYAFTHGPAQVRSHRVATRRTDISDHLPILLTLSLPER